MAARKYNDVMKEVKSVLLTYQDSVSLEEFRRSYKAFIGERLPTRILGFPSDVEFLQSMPNVVNVCTNKFGNLMLTGIADETSEHIQRLVSKQQKSKSNSSNSNTSFSKHRSCNFKDNNLFLSATLRVEILKVMHMYPDGIELGSFVLAYRKTFNKSLPLVSGLDSLEAIVDLIPELEIKTEEDIWKTIHSTNSCTGNYQEKITTARRNTFALQQTKDQKTKEASPTNNTYDIEKCEVIEDVLRNFQLLLEKHPGGIPDVLFPALYENLTGRHFDLYELGYQSLLELVDALPDVFEKIFDPKGNMNWIILPADSTDKHCSGDRNSVAFNPGIQMPPKVRDGIPADAASPNLQYLHPKISEHIDLNVYVPVFVSSIINPSLFWILLQTDDNIQEFKKLESDMELFYNTCASYKYMMKDCHIAIGAICVIRCPEDNHWYRAVIKGVPTVNLVNVLFVDYGSRENVPRDNLHYLRSKYLDYPAYAFRAQLAGLKPPNNASSWNVKTQQRFIQLCRSASLMAYLKPDVGAFSAYLCDTSGDSDIHLNDTLIKEGFAEVCLENQLDMDSSYLLNKSEQSMSHGNMNDSQNDLSSGSLEQNYNVSHSDEDCFISGSMTLPSPQMLPFTSQKHFDDIESNILHCRKEQDSKRYVKPHFDDIESNILHCRKEQDSKRYVKQVQLCDDNKIHVVKLENKLYTSCGDMCRLLWSEKDSSILIQRLKYKEVDIPFLKLSKEDHASLFKQCIWYKIPEYEKLESSNASLILYPLEWGFNILNIFGHPSTCLRLAIQHEIRNFDPFDPIWREFSYAEMHDLDDIEKEIEKNLCLYDLKIKNNALEIKRIKLLTVKNTSPKEIKRADYLQSAVERRIKQIENICSQCFKEAFQKSQRLCYIVFHCRITGSPAQKYPRTLPYRSDFLPTSQKFRRV